MATILFQKQTFQKWDYGDYFIADFDTDGDVTLLNCKICRKYIAQIRTVAWSRNLHGQVLDSILPYVDDVTYAHKANIYNHVKVEGLHD